MVFKHNELTFAVNLDPLAYGPLNQSDNDVASFPELSPLMPEKLATIVGRQDIFYSNHLDNVNVGGLNESSHGALGGSITMSNGVEKLNGDIIPEQRKRHLAADEDRLLTSKRPKNLEPTVHLDSGLCINSLQGSLPGEEATHADAQFQVNNVPSRYQDNLRADEGHQSRNIYPSFLDCYPRKLVAVGPKHQAILPECRFNDIKNHSGKKDDCLSSLLPAESSSSAGNTVVGDDYNGKMTGTCIMPMPSDASLFSDIGILHHNIDCRCYDVGSARCARWHITEVRKNLHKELGHDKFAELGFFNMGEYVAERWTEEEEHLFEQVVLSNPASLGKNFWEVLPSVLASRTTKELVSYYFNVFILHKRVAQNRLDPLNVDSDNDEWQESDYCEYAMEEEEEEEDGDDDDDDDDDDNADNDDDSNEEVGQDSAVESPEEQGATCVTFYDEEIDEDRESDESEEYKVIKVGEGRMSAFSKASTGNSSLNCIDEYEVQDDSCTSFEDSHNRNSITSMDFSGGLLENVETRSFFVEDNENLLRNDGLSAIANHDFFEGHYGPKIWDMSYSHGELKDDFFSTCNVIEEVFGDEPWKSNANFNKP